MASWLFLIASVIGALHTFNAYLPQRRTGPLTIPSFFAGWLTAEMPIQHFVWQVVATLIFVWAGALDALPGQIGLAIAVGSWAALLAIVPLARSAEYVLEAALSAGLGRDYTQQIPESERDSIDEHVGPTRTPLHPFRFGHPSVSVTRNIEYVPGGGKRNQLDVYVPESGVTRAPVLLQIHGGGWVIGDKSQQALPLMTHMASRGWICVATNYRLSPKATFPEHLIDLKLAIKWIRENIAEFGGDPDFICATGGSAGGHLSSLVGLTANDPQYQPGFENLDTSVKAVVPFYGVYDFSDHYGLQAHKGMQGFIERMVLKKRKLESLEDFRNASPMHRIHADAPPFFVIHGSSDSLASVEEARHFAALLRGASKEPVAYAEIPGAQHAFDVFHSIRCSCAVQSVDHFLSWVRFRQLPCFEP
jgi:acetyl esterase/lipase